MGQAKRTLLKPKNAVAHGCSSQKMINYCLKIKHMVCGITIYSHQRIQSLVMLYGEYVNHQCWRSVPGGVLRPQSSQLRMTSLSVPDVSVSCEVFQLGRWDVLNMP